MRLLKVLFVSSEVFPLVKTGGLADVSGALPSALQKLGVDVRILMPGYPSVLTQLTDLKPITTLQGLPIVESIDLLMGTITETNVKVMVVKSATLYERDGGPYADEHGHEWQDNAVRFGVLSKVAAILTAQKQSSSQSSIGWHPDIVHCNDWQTGLTPAYMKLTEKTKTKSLISIHNMAFQGCYPSMLMHPLGLPTQHYNIEGFEYHGQLSFLKAGIFYADAISTVSPRYAQEIQTPILGFGLEGLLTKRSREITGILNGIDTQEWNPEHDIYLDTNYTIKNLNQKSLVKKALQTKLGLTIDANAPLLGIVSRLSHQKGLDMLLPNIANLLAQGCQLVMLGSGDRPLEKAFFDLAIQHPTSIAVTIGYHEPLSHHIMAGADMFIMPSRFEPCGLNQLYGLSYGTPPIVNATGGLADSVVDTNLDSIKRKTANGFVMSEANPEGLLNAIHRAIEVYKNDKSTWRKIQKNGMALNLSWDHSAREYLKLYEHLIDKKD